MKYIYSIYSIILAAFILLAGCKNEELTDSSPQDNQAFTVNFKLGGSAGLIGTRAGELHTAEERNVKSLWAVVFNDPNETFYRAIQIKLPEDGQTTEGLSLSFSLESAGVFKVCFIANPNETLKQFMETLSVGNSNINDFKGYYATQRCDDKLNGLLMTSPFYSVVSNWTESYNIDQVILTRAMSRIDIKNEITGLEIKRIEFINRAINTRLYQDNITSLENDVALENRVYDIAIPSQSECKAEIYTYEQKANTNQGQTDKLPAIKIYYTTENEPDITKEHTVTLIYNGGDTTEPTAVGLKRNYLYTVTFSRTPSDINANITVLDWNTGDEITVEPGEIGGGENTDNGNGYAENPSDGGSIDVIQ